MITLKQLEDEIRLIAYQLYELRGKEPGHEVEDWLEAEKIVLGKYLSIPIKLVTTIYLPLPSNLFNVVSLSITNSGLISVTSLVIKSSIGKNKTLLV